MKKILKRFAYLATTALLVFGASCSEIPDEITELETSRLFSPTEFTALVLQKINVQLKWSGRANVELYRVQLFTNEDFSGVPSLEREVVASELPITITNLEGETTYYARVRAEADGIEPSKWISVRFSTDAEQIFILPIPSADIESDQVILRWPAGESADVIDVYLGTNTSGTPVTSHTLTAGEIADGSAVVTGLASQTQYTAVMKRAGSTRGTATFTTKIDLGGATEINDGDDLAAIIAAAEDGEAFVIMSGTFELSGDITLTKSIKISGYDSDARPTIHRATFKMSTGVSIALDNLIFDATKIAGESDATYLFQYSTAGTYGAITVTNCDLSGYTRSFIQASQSSIVMEIESITIDNCTIQGFAKSNNEMFDLRTGAAKDFVFTNNTLWNSGAAGRQIFRIDDNTAYSPFTSTMNISNNTFYNITADRILYVRLPGIALTVSKNMFVACHGHASNQENVPSNPTPIFDQNNYFNNTGSIGTKDSSLTRTAIDPEFPADAATTGVFTVGNEILKSLGVGDPRWLQ